MGRRGLIADEKKQYLCNECGHKSFYNSAMHEHMRRHNRDPKEKPHKCSLCKFASKGRKYFVTHMKAKHDKDVGIFRPKNEWKGILQRCQQCDYSTLVRQTLMVHMRKHTGEKPFKCDQCSYAGRQKTLLEIHKRSVHENLWYECEQCDFKTSQKSALKTHILVMHEVGKHLLQEKCDVCGKTLRKDYLKYHIAKIHLGEGSAQMQEEHQQLSTTLSCSEGDYQGTNKRSLKKHVKINHLGIKYTCDECDYKVGSKQSLKMHKEDKHLGIKDKIKHEGVKYSCDVCEFQFSFKRSLTKHVENKHLGIRYKCDDCAHELSSKQSLKMHVEQNHLGIIYGCDICSFKANSKKNLKTHNRKIHLGIKQK